MKQEVAAVHLRTIAEPGLAYTSMEIGIIMTGSNVDLSETTAKTQLLESLRWLCDASNVGSNR